jgi:hypothetical protein
VNHVWPEVNPATDRSNPVGGFLGSSLFRLVRGRTPPDRGNRLRHYQTFRIDNWFGPKWFGFCGKLVGAVGVANDRNVVIPPFVQNRLTAQSLFVRDDDGSYSHQGDGPKVHNIGTSESNFKNHARDAAPDTTLFWISGNSMRNGRGSIMSYKPGPTNYWMFYVEYQNESRDPIGDFLRSTAELDS